MAFASVSKFPFVTTSGWSRRWLGTAAALVLATGFSFGARAADSAPAAKADQKAPVKGEKMSDSKTTTVVVETSQGNFEVELNAEKAPISVANFLKYVDSHFYDGTIFHRVIDNFMIQGGGFTSDMTQKPTQAPIKNEAGNGLKNLNGTLAMARTNVVDSATAQFFVNVKDNDFLNHTSDSPQGYGYAVFGKVTSGMDVVNKIKAVPTTMKAGMQDVPATPVMIKSIKRK